MNKANIEKYLTESCLKSANIKFSLTLFIKSWTGSKLDEQSQGNLVEYEMV